MIRLPAAEVFRHRDFLLFWIARCASVFAVQMQAVAIAWLVYDRARQTETVTQSAFMLGMIGLAQFLPIAVLSLFAGQAADRHDRKQIILLCYAGEALCGVALTVYALSGLAALWPVFIIAAAFGGVRAFMAPAMSAIIATLVPREDLPAAVSWNSLAWQAATILGPAGAGYLYALGAWAPFATMAALMALAIAAVRTAKPPTREAGATGRSLLLIAEGIAYLGKNRIVLGAISLDLMAVLLGGATAMLPAYARDVLHAGPAAFGHLRAAPAIGAVAVALVLAARPLRAHIGAWMFAGVGVFGIATIVFGLSTVFWLAFAALIALGAGDMLSVYVRQSLIQLSTPDEMRGRVSAVSSVFVSASNELGEFESGVMARLLGVVPSVVLGGAASCVVAAAWIILFPELRKADRWQAPARAEV